MEPAKFVAFTAARTAKPTSSAVSVYVEAVAPTAHEERVQADIDAGKHGELVGELRGLVAEHPLREGFRRQLILALYRSGRQAEALEAYQAARRMLDEELGLEPSAMLRELEGAVLRQDPSLDAPADGRARVRPAPEARPLPPRRAWVAAVTASTLLAFAVAAGVVWVLNRDDVHRSVAAATPQVAPAKPNAKKTTRNDSRPSVRVVTRVVRPRARATVVSRPTTRQRPARRAGASTRQAGDPEAARPASRPVRLAKPKPAPKPAPRPAPYRATDDFEDPVTSDFWRRFGATGVEVAERNGQLQFTFDGAAGADGDGWFGATYESRCRFQGDFDLRLDYELPRWPVANGVSLQATAWFGTHGLTIARQSHTWGEQYNSWTRNGGAVPTADVKGTLRLRRKNGTLFSYYRENGEWSVLRTFVFGDPVTILLQAGSTNALFADQAVTAAFDNFALTSPTRPSC